METAHSFRTALCLAQRRPREAGLKLLEEGWRARRDTEPLSVQPPIDWLDARDHDANWRFQLHSWRLIDSFIVARDRTKKRAWTRSIIPVMLDWSKAEAAYGASCPELFWNDMGTGHRAARLAYVLSLPELAKRRNAGNRLQLQALGDRHVERLRRPDFFSLTNHGFFQVHGLMALAQTLPQTPDLREAQVEAKAMLVKLMHQQFGREGVHLEHSPGYHGFALRTVKQLLGSGWYDDLEEVVSLRDKALAAQPWFTFPNGRISAIGDSSRRKSDLLPYGQNGPSAAKFFEEAGYAVVRSSSDVVAENAFMLIACGGHHSSMHKHADDLSFELFDKGRFWIVDSGRYTYSQSKIKDHMRSAAAHNSVDLLEERDDNGLRQTVPAGGLLNSVRLEGDTWIIDGRLSRPAFGVSHARTFRYIPGRRLVLEDRISCAQRRKVTAWLHLAPDLSAVQSKEGWRLAGATIRYEANVPLVRVRHRGSKSPVQGWSAPFYHRLEPVDALGAALEGEEIMLRTIIEFSDGTGKSAYLNRLTERLARVLSKLVLGPNYAPLSDDVWPDERLNP